MSNTPAVGLEDFARHVSKTNPFTQDRITQAQSNQADVSSIHQKEFKTLIRRIEEVRRSGQTTGIWLTGAAGVGKSHLLARLFRWAKEDGRATVVYLHNLLSSPERTGRYLLHATVNALAGNRPSDFAHSELYSLINLAIGAKLKTQTAGKVKGAAMAPNLSVRSQILKEIGHEIDADQLVMPVFISYLQQAMGANLAEEAAEARALAAVQWLSGETIDASVARSIGLRVADEDDSARIEDDVAVQRTLDVICRLCECAQRPFVLCLDQVDNLSDDRVKALMSFLHAMIDNGHNLVLVVSGVKDSMDRLQKTRVVPDAALDRVAQHRINLAQIAPKDAKAIILERLEKFCAPFKDVKELADARKSEPLAPLSSGWWNSQARDLIEMRPRSAIRAARDAWEIEQDKLAELSPKLWLRQLGGKETNDTHGKRNASNRPLPPVEALIDELIARKVTEAINARKLNPARLPPDADNIATLTLTLLEACVGAHDYSLCSVRRTDLRAKSPYDLWVEEESPDGKGITNGLTFFTSDAAQSAVVAVRRLLNDDKPPTHQMLVTDEQRRPLRLGAKGQEYYSTLLQSPRFLHVKLNFEHHAQLDALSSVLGAARVGDLDIPTDGTGYRPITEAECRASMHRQQVFVKHPLLQHLLTEDVGPSVPGPIVGDGVTEQIKAQIKGELAMNLSMTAREMATIIIEHSSQDAAVFPKIWEMVKVVANQMHQQKQLFVDAIDDDLYLQLA